MDGDVAQGEHYKILSWGGLTDPIELMFSVRQGDPIALILYLIFVEPLLLRLRKRMPGVKVGGVSSGIEGYVDDVSLWVSSEEELLLLEEIFRQFESFSGAMLNRVKKSKILGFGSWKKRKRWPLAWLKSVKEVKIFGFFWKNSYKEMLKKNWETTVEKFQKCLLGWELRCLPTLRQRVFVLQVFTLPIIWYRAHLLPAPSDVCLGDREEGEKISLEGMAGED